MSEPLDPFMGLYPRPKTKGPSFAAWEIARPFIKELYVDENKKLKDVIDIMSKEHNHDGT